MTLYTVYFLQEQIMNLQFNFVQFVWAENFSTEMPDILCKEVELTPMQVLAMGVQLSHNAIKGIKPGIRHGSPTVPQN